MNDIKRYDHSVFPETDYYSAYSVMDEKPDGDYVRYDDMIELLARMMERGMDREKV